MLKQVLSFKRLWPMREFCGEINENEDLSVLGCGDMESHNNFCES